MNETHDTTGQLRASAAAYLRYVRQYPVIAFERGLDYSNRPDILAVTKSKYLVEVEIKVTVADFKNDRKKRKYQHEVWHGVKRRQFYYCVSRHIVDKVLTLLPQDCGLMTLGDRKVYGTTQIKIVRKGPVNRTAGPITLRQVVEMVRNQSGTLCSMAQGMSDMACAITEISKVKKEASP